MDVTYLYVGDPPPALMNFLSRCLQVVEAGARDSNYSSVGM